jgi:uncharacterized protein YdeI (YjbR/CyaY-like superfamily)
VPDDLRAALDRNARAAAFFTTLSSQPLRHPVRPSGSELEMN